MMRAAAAGPCARTVFAALLSLALAAPAVADWERIGPPGGTVRAFAVDPQRPQVAWALVLGAGLWRTGDAGETWRRVPGRRDELGFDTLAVHPRRPQWLFAAGQGGVFRSRDGGRSWVESRRGLAGPGRPLYVGALALAPSNPRILYAATQRGVAGSRPHRSADGGLTWRRADGGLPPCAYGGPLVVHPDDDATVLFACAGRVYRTTDGGGHWERAAGLPGAPVQALAFDPARPDRAYATMWRPYGGALLFRSVDGGAHWSARSADLPRARLATIAVSAVDSGSLWVGSDQGQVERSTDGGRTFAPARGGLPPVGLLSPVRLLVAAPQEAGRVWVVSGVFGQAGPSLFRTDDGGESWAAAMPPVRASAIVDVAPSATPGHLTVLTPGALPLHRTEDGGISWTRADHGLPLTEIAPRRLEVDPSDRDRLYLTTSNGLFASTDAGASWGRIAAGSLDGSLGDLAISPAAPHHLFVTREQGIARSLDGGATWEELPLLYTVAGLHAAPTAPDLLYATARQCVYGHCNSLLLRSADGGATWENRGGLAAETLLAVDAASPDVLWAGVIGGLARFDATTGATAEVSIAEATGRVTQLAQDPDESQRLVAATSEGEVWRSPDGGASWALVEETLGVVVDDLALDPHTDGRIYVGTVAGLFATQLP